MMDVAYRNLFNLDWLIIALCFSLGLLALSRYFFPATFSMFIILPANDKYIKLNKKKGKALNGFHILLSLFQIINVALFAYLAKHVFEQHAIDFYPPMFWVFFVSLLGYLLLKIILQLGNGYFFQHHDLMTDLIFEKLSYFNYSGIVAFSGNILLAFVFQESVATVYVIFLLILGINIIGIINMLRNRQNLILNNIMYFILYLCALEISPLVILISFLKD